MLSIAGFRVPSNFGWVEDPIDVRDVPLRDSPFAAVSATDALVDNSKYFLPVSDQLSLPSCVANACADMMEAATVLDKVNGGQSLEAAIAGTPDLSRLFIWWNARSVMDPPQTSNPKSGTNNRLAMDSLSRFGVCSEARWPYDMLKATTRPSIMSYREAMPNRFDAFYSIDSDDDDRIGDIIRTLNAKHNVLFGTALTKPFMSYSSGVLRRPSAFEYIVGYHAMVICGWDPARQAFKVRNSWSPSYGEAGYCWMHADYITWSKTRSLWTATKGAL